jgi:hypothetical protein
MNLDALGKWLLILGLGIAILGGLFWLLGRFWPGLSDLPGTLKLQTGSLTCVFPILASIVLSVLLTIVLNVLARILRK